MREHVTCLSAQGTLSILALATVTMTGGCSSTCEEAAQKIGLSGRSSINEIARAFLQDQLTLPPHGNCGANTIDTLQICQQEAENDIAGRAGIVCPIAARASKTLNATQPAGPTTDLSVVLRLSPIASFKGTLKANALANSCRWALTHVHDGSGAAGGDPQRYADRQYLATFDFRIEVATDAQVRYITDGEFKTVDVSAGSSCSTTGLDYSGCRYVQDGGMCNVRTAIQLEEEDTPAETPAPGG